MGAIPRIACINDISGFGRCSLTTAISVISAIGVQVCPCPTAVLSKHTGFDAYTFRDLTDDLSKYFSTWDDIDLDAVYTGFLGSPLQIELVSDFILRRREINKNVCVITDPVMGDKGRLYPVFDSEMINKMRNLVELADILTPNITEACFLTGTEYKGEDISDDDAKYLLEKLSEMNANKIVLTGIRRDETIINMTWDKGEISKDEIIRQKTVFSGTGDIFASIVSGFIMKGRSLKDAVNIAGRFISDAIEYTVKQNSEVTDGVVFEPLLVNLGKE